MASICILNIMNPCQMHYEPQHIINNVCCDQLIRGIILQSTCHYHTVIFVNFYALYFILNNLFLCSCLFRIIFDQK